MKYIFCIAAFISFSFFASAQNTNTSLSIPDTTKKILVVEAACGQCQFGLAGKGCNLAIRINGHAHYVEGADIDAFGDAHAKDGFCESIRMAKVQGEVVDDKFILHYFELQKK